MIKIKCFINNEKILWLRDNISGGVVNLSWTTKEKFIASSYDVAWTTEYESKPATTVFFKKHEDATAFKLKFRL